MLVVLDDSIAAQSKHLSQREIECLDDILLSHDKLRHYIGAKKRTALTLAAELQDQLSPRAIQALKTISTQSNDLTGLLSLATHFAVVQRSGLAGCHFSVTHQQKKWECDLAFAAKWFSNSTRLIGEHLTDTKIFVAAAVDYALTNNLEANIIKVLSDMSGGSGSAHEVISVRVREAEAPVLCLIDSDKLAPHFGNSASVAKCHVAVDPTQSVSYFEPLKERELENVLPDPLIEGAINELKVSPDRDEILRRSAILASIRANVPLIYNHIDIKNGTCMSWVTTKNVANFFGGCVVIQPCSCNRHCVGMISPPLFDDVLGKAADFIDKTSPRKLFTSLKNTPRQSWLEIGRAVFSFALSNNVRNT